MSAHTPGNWEAISWRDPPSCGRTTLAVMDDSDIGVRVIAVFEDETDAILASAAKDLLEACKRAYEQTDRNARPADYEILRAAIAKATGRAP